MQDQTIPAPLALVARLLAGAVVLAGLGAAAHAERASGPGRPAAAAVRGTAPQTKLPPSAADRSPEYAADPLLAVVSIGEQRISLYAGTRLISRGGVSTGKPGHRTPTGVFSVIQKNRWHTSNIYSNAPMPFMQRITWSGIALHEGSLPGYPASHGCIRLTRDFASYLWGETKLGNRVVVAPTDVRPVAFSHPKLPKPLLAPVLQDVAASTLVSVQPEVTQHKLLNPLEHARILRSVTASATSAAERAARDAMHFATFKAAAAQRAVTTQQEASAALADAERRLADARIVVTVAQGEALDRARETLIDAEDHLVEARRIAAEAEVEENSATPAAFDAARQVRLAEAAVAAAVSAARDAKRRLEPLSVFISRKDRRVYLRQGFEALADAPITITDADQPLGTHLFMALEPNGRSELDWLALTVPEATIGARTPASALDRIEMPDDVLQLISARLWAGAGLIISDHGLGETGQGTDFVILTR